MKAKRETGFARFRNDKRYDTVIFTYLTWHTVLGYKTFRCKTCGEVITDYGYYTLRDKNLQCPCCYNAAMNNTEAFCDESIAAREQQNFDKLLARAEAVKAKVEAGKAKATTETA